MRISQWSSVENPMNRTRKNIFLGITGLEAILSWVSDIRELYKVPLRGNEESPGHNQEILLLVFIRYFFDGRQIACRCRSSEDLLDEVVGEDRLFSVAAQVVHLTAFDSEIVSFAIVGQQGLLRLLIRRLIQKHHMDRLVIFGHVQILVGDGFDFPHRPHEKPDLVARGFFKLTLDPLLQPGRILFLRFKNDISALDVRLHALQPEGLEYPLEIFHFDDCMPADVDGAEKGYIFVHQVNGWVSFNKRQPI